LTLPEGVYERVDAPLASEWQELRDVDGVELECERHPGHWWPSAGKDIEAKDIQTWRCPSCAWSFRQGFAGRGGTPQY
jgi:hypothetical protein